MSHSLIRLRKKVNNTPHLMALNEFEQVLQYLDSSLDGREVDTPEPRMEDEDEMHNSRYTIYEDDKAALFSVEGPMTNKPISFYGMDCGGFSYQQFKQDFEFIAEKGVKTVGLMIDSGGGEAYGLFDSTNYIRSIADEYGIKIITYGDGTVASAAYGLAAISDEIIVNSSSDIGSIGVVVRLLNDSGALKKAGYERVFVTAGKEKVPFDADGAFKESFLADIQDKIDVMFTEFSEHVASYRNISVDEVRSTEARVFLGPEAVALGLADEVMTLEEFYSYFSEQAENRTGSAMLPNKLFKSKKEERLEMSTESVELHAQLESLKEEFEQTKAKAALELKEALGQVTSLTADLTNVQSELEAALTQVKELHQEKELAKTEARKEKLSAVLPKDKVDAVAASLSNLADEQFDVVLEGYTASAKALEQSDLLKELGSEGQEIELEVDEAQDGTLAAIRNKLNIK